MNQDQVKDILLQLDGEIEEFSLIFSGKQSKKVNGLYKPEVREIILHNKNFEDEQDLIYTAIHEFAHHVHITKYGLEPGKQRPHTIEFRAIFHDLLELAEAKGLYANKVERIPQLRELASKIKNEYMTSHGELMKGFGQALMEAERTCREYGARFEEFLERSLGIQKQAATIVMRSKAMDLPSQLGYENMRNLASIKDAEVRQSAVQGLMDGKTPDQVKRTIKLSKPELDESAIRKRLEQEQRRITKTITSLQERLEEIEELLEDMPSYDES